MTRLAVSCRHCGRVFYVIDSPHAVRDPSGTAYNRTAYLEGRAKMIQDRADYLKKLMLKAMPH